MSSLTREDSSVSTFYTKLRGYWDELANYRPRSQCTCGANKSSLEYHQQECMLQVLWGLMILLHTYGDKFFFLNPYHQWITFSHWFYKKNNKRGWLCIQAARLKLQLHSIIVLLWPLKVISTNHILKRTDLCANTVAEQGMLLRSVLTSWLSSWLSISQRKTQLNPFSAVNISILENQSQPTISQPNPPLTQEQYQQLLTLLNTHSTVESPHIANQASNQTNQLSSLHMTVFSPFIQLPQYYKH